MKNSYNLQTIDLLKFIVIFKSNLKSILLFSFFGFVFGVCISFFFTPRFESTSKLLPQSSDGSKVGSRFSGLASMAGINLSNMGGSEESGYLSPKYFQVLVASDEFILRCMEEKILLGNDSIAINEFLKISSHNDRIFSNISKVFRDNVFGNLRSGKSYDSDNINLSYKDIIMDPDKYSLGILLKEKFNVSFDDEELVIDIKTFDSDPFIAFQLNHVISEALQKFIVDIKIEKAILDLQFSKKMVSEQNFLLESVELSYAEFYNSTLDNTSLFIRYEEDKLKREMLMRESLVSKWNEILEENKFRIQRNTPIFTQIKGPNYPFKKVFPNRLLFAFAFMVLSGGFRFGYYFLKEK